MHSFIDRIATATQKEQNYVYTISPTKDSTMSPMGSIENAGNSELSVAEEKTEDVQLSQEFSIEKAKKMPTFKAKYKIQKKIPVSSARTYKVEEIPYHAPSEFYMIGFRYFTGFQHHADFYKRAPCEPLIPYFAQHKIYPAVSWEKKPKPERNTIFQTIFTPQSTILHTDSMYVWCVDQYCNFLFAPEDQQDFADNRFKVKHGDICALYTSTDIKVVGTTDAFLMKRYPARLGGMIRFSQEKNKWIIDNDSSYCFFREDGKTISNGLHVKWHILLDQLLRAYGVNTSQVLYHDIIQSRKMDHWIFRNIVLRSQISVHRKAALKAPLQFSSQNKLLGLFQDVNLLEFLLTGFDLNIYLLTEGKLSLDIIKLDNVNIKGLSEQLIHEHRLYCEVSVLDIHGLPTNTWWSNTHKTSLSSIKEETNQYVWDLNDAKNHCEFYIASKKLEVIQIIVKCHRIRSNVALQEDETIAQFVAPISLLFNRNKLDEHYILEGTALTEESHGNPILHYNVIFETHFSKK